MILDPLDKELVKTLFTTNLLLGEDEYCQDYLEFFRKREKDFDHWIAFSISNEHKYKHLLNPDVSVNHNWGIIGNCYEL